MGGRREAVRVEAPAESVSDKFTPLAGKEEHRGGAAGRDPLKVASPRRV